mgnify:CR=1 FL=1
MLPGWYLIERLPYFGFQILNKNKKEADVVLFHILDVVCSISQAIPQGKIVNALNKLLVESPEI